MSKKINIAVSIFLLLFYIESVFAVQTPEPSFDGTSIVWKATDAKSINIHQANGGYITSLPGNSTKWKVPASGSYFLVASDDGGWTGWARSKTVSADLAATPGTPDNNLALQGVTSAVYSRRSIELFWDSASSTPFVNVEVKRDGVVVGTRDGTSFYETNLSRGTTYKYTLTPIDVAGNKGVSSSIAVTTNGSGNTGTPPASPINTVSPPAELRFAVYSGSSIELFWKNASDYNAQTTSYSVYQDGKLIKNMRIGTSYYITGLAAGTTYEFAVSAVNSASEESKLQRIQVTTNGNGQPVKPPSNPDITYAGNTIFWPNDGYYQVQSTVDFSTVCEAVRSCDVPSNGTYIVINHTTGKRTRIEVTSAVAPIADVELNVREPLEPYPFSGPSALRTLSQVSEYFETMIPADRPFFKLSEEIPTTGFDTARTTHIISIDLDETGTGTYSDEKTESEAFDNDVTVWNSNATRTNNGSSVIWEGTYYWLNNSAFRGTDITFKNETKFIDTTLRSQSGQISRAGIGVPIPAIEVTYDVVGKLVDGTSRCEPVSGSIVFDSEYLMNGSTSDTNQYKTTVSKATDEQVWTVTNRTADGEFVEAYKAQSVGVDFYCGTADQ